MKRVILSRLAIIVVLYPWLVSYGPIDSLVTEIGLSVASGKEVRVTRGCEGTVLSRDNLPFKNVAASASRQLTPEVTVGGAVGFTRARDNGDWIDMAFDTSQNSLGFRDISVFYAKPRVSFDWRYFGFAGGAVIATPRLDFSDESSLSPLASLRVGSRKGFAWETHLWDNDLLVGPGWFYTGFAFAFPVGEFRKQYARVHFGFAGGPYEEGGIQMSAEMPFDKFMFDPGFFYDPEDKGYSLFAKIRYRYDN
jgi:hypothetical protein